MQLSKDLRWTAASTGLGTKVKGHLVRHIWEEKPQSFKLLLNNETALTERLSKTNSKQFVWRSSYLVSKLNLSVSQRQEHSHLVLSVCSQPAAGCLIPNLCMEGFRKTTCCVSVHQNQHSHHSVNACQRRTKANAHKHHTLLIVQLFIILGSGFPWGFWRLPHPEKGLRSRLCPHRGPEHQPDFWVPLSSCLLKQARQLESHVTGHVNFRSMFSLVQHWFY